MRISTLLHFLGCPLVTMPCLHPCSPEFDLIPFLCDVLICAMGNPHPTPPHHTIGRLTEGLQIGPPRLPDYSQLSLQPAPRRCPRLPTLRLPKTVLFSPHHLTPTAISHLTSLSCSSFLPLLCFLRLSLTLHLPVFASSSPLHSLGGQTRTRCLLLLPPPFL